MIPCGSKRNRIVAIAMTALLAAPLPSMAAKAAGAEAPSGGGRVKAKVLKSDGKTAIAGATVRAYHLDSGRTYPSAPTNAKGECEITGLPYGYLDLMVETGEGTFVGSQVVNISPAGTAVVSLTVTKYEERTPAWWSGKTQREIPGTQKASQGIAEIRTKAVGREFWTSPKGIAIIGGSAAAALLLLTAGGGSSSSASPSTP